MTNWLEKTKRPVLPIYLAALVWPIMALVLPIYTLGGLIATAVISAGVYIAGTKLCPVRVVRVPVAYATGSEDVDALLNGVTANLDALHKLNDDIPAWKKRAAALRTPWQRPRTKRAMSIVLPATTCRRWSS